MPPTLTKFAVEVQRAALPEVLFAADLALALGTTPGGARRLVRSGLCRYLYVGRRLAVRREALLAGLADREVARG